MTYTFYRLTGSPSTRTVPSLAKVPAQSREQAIESFARKFGLKVIEVGETVWFSNEDGDWEYDVRD